MAFTSGTIAGGTAAANHTALLVAIHDFCTTGLGASNWIDIKWQELVGSSPDAPYNQRQWMFIAPGLSGTEQIFGGIRTRTAGTYANFELAGYFGNFGSDPSWNTDFENQPLAKFAYVTLWADPIDYWIVANGQRCIVVCRVGTVWTAFHIGKILPYASPSEYPYPFFLAGTNNDVTAQISDVAGHRTFQCGARGSQYIFLNTNDWSEVGMWDNGSETSVNAAESYVIQTANPWFGSSNPYATFAGSKANPDGTVNLMPLEIITTRSPGATLGQIEGAYWCSGLDQNGSVIPSGSIITISSVQYLIIPNIFRINSYDFMAVRLS